MERALFEGWTENQLGVSFTAVAAGEHTKEVALSTAFWRNVAYIAVLTGGTLLKPPTP